MEIHREERSESFRHSKPHGLFRSNFRVFKIKDIKTSSAFGYELRDRELMV
jgi:hypothetical protein